METWASLSSGLQASLIITFALMIILIIAGASISRLKVDQVPGTFQLMFISLVDMVNENQKDFFKKHWAKYTPLLLTIFIYLSLANTASLFGLTAPLSNLSVAIGFSLFAFLTIQLNALAIKGPVQRAKDLMDPHPAFLPINLIGEMSTPFAMGLRLFGNLVSGSILAVFIYSVLGWASLLVGPFLHAVFDIFFGVVQAYVYYMLLSIFLSGAVED
jgi:F-type H+-transporting ATPase subunit a